MKACCENCIYSAPVSGHLEIFECRRNSPAQGSSPEREECASLGYLRDPRVLRWPIVSDYDWCGEFVSRGGVKFAQVPHVERIAGDA